MDFPNAPSEQTAREVVQGLTNSSIVSVKRFSTVKAHFVYDVKTSNDELVVRLTRPEQRRSFESAVYWYNLLKPKGVPFSTIRSHDLVGSKTGFPYIVMDRVPGTDLAHVYIELSPVQKEILAGEIVNIQNTVAQLKPASGFGYALSYEDPKLFKSWRGVMDLYLNRINTRNAKTGVIEQKYIYRLEQLNNSFGDYIDRIKPTAFLDDITTKNVIMYNGKLSGVVDFDYVCFGDPLLNLALTRMSLLAMKTDTFYTDHWAKLLKLTDEQKRVLDFYTGLFALEFASSMGHRFNKDTDETVNTEELNHLLATFNTVTKEL